MHASTPALPSANFTLWANILDDLLHPTRKTPEDDDPSRPFTPPPPQPSKEEEEDDDNDGPSFPLNPALA